MANGKRLDSFWLQLLWRYACRSLSSESVNSFTSCLELIAELNLIFSPPRVSIVIVYFLLSSFLRKRFARKALRIILATDNTVAIRERMVTTVRKSILKVFKIEVVVNV